METPAHYSLLQLQQHLGKVISLNLRQAVWIKAELSEVDIRVHGYFTLLEQDEWGAVKARAEAVLWKKDIARLQKKMGDLFGAILQKGRQVLLQVLPEMHVYYGLKLTIQDVFEQYTIGQMALQRQQTRQRLQQAGLWQLNHQRVMPIVPQRVAVISSKEAAGLQDFEQQLQGNRFGYRFTVELFHAAVQGNNALREIPQQFEAIRQRAGAFDCVALVRGGGAKLDLAEFDQYAICEAVARCPLPVLTGIGHDIDNTLTDEVAHTTQKTPTAAANYLIEQCLQYDSAVQQRARRIVQQIQQQFQQQQLAVQTVQSRLLQAFRQHIFQAQQQLQQIEQRAAAADMTIPLQRGFALIFDEQGKWIRTAEQLAQAGRITIRFADGRMTVDK